MTKPRFDAIIHAPNRLQICAFLAPLEEAEFQVLREELEVSDSVLSKHLKLLLESGYVRFRKNAVSGRQRVWVSLTSDGRRALAGHIKELQRLVGI